MADHYMSFAEEIKNVPPQAVPWIKNVLTFDPESWSPDDPEYRQFLKDVDIKPEETEDLIGWPGFSWLLDEREGMTAQLALRAEDSYTEDHLIWFVQALFRRFMPDGIFKMTSAFTCSRLIAGEFGGAWLVVTSDRVEGGTTQEALEVVIAKMKQKPYRIHVAIEVKASDAEEAYKKLYETMYEVDREEFSWESTDEWYDPNGDSIFITSIEDIRMRVIGQKDEESGC